MLKIYSKPKKKRTVKQSNEAATTTKKNRKRERQKYIKNIYKVITGSSIVDLFGSIRDSVIIKNIRAFISDYVIINKTAFMTVYKIAPCSLLTAHF